MSESDTEAKAAKRLKATKRKQLSRANQTPEKKAAEILKNAERYKSTRLIPNNVDCEQTITDTNVATDDYIDNDEAIMSVVSEPIVWAEESKGESDQQLSSPVYETVQSIQQNTTKPAALLAEANEVQNTSQGMYLKYTATTLIMSFVLPNKFHH